VEVYQFVEHVQLRELNYHQILRNCIHTKFNYAPQRDQELKRWGTQFHTCMCISVLFFALASGFLKKKSFIQLILAMKQ